MTDKNSTTLSLKTKKDVKELAELRAQEIGLPLGTVINAFLREFGRTGELHLKAYDQLSVRGEALLREAQRQNKDEVWLSGPFEGADDLIRYLDGLQDENPHQ